MHRHAYGAPNVRNTAKITKHTKMWRTLSEADFDLGRESRGPSARARARARARALSSKKVPGFPRWETLGQKFANLLLICAQWSHLGRGIFQLSGDRVTHMGALSVADFNLRRESRGPSARARARARARAFVKKSVPSFSRWGSLGQKLQICCSDVPNGHIWVVVFFIFFRDRVTRPGPLTGMG